jgi:hypothetical protein
MRIRKLQGFAEPAQKEISIFRQSFVPHFFVQVVFSFGGPCIILSGPVWQVLCLNIYLKPMSVAGGYRLASGSRQAFSLAVMSSARVVWLRSSGSSSQYRAPF